MSNAEQLSAMRRRHMMIDFETLGLTSDAVLLSLGVVVIDPLTDSTESFSVNIDPRSQPGSKIDASTVLWWLGQAVKNPDAAKPLLDAVKMLDDDLPEDYTDEYEEQWYRNKAYSLDHAAQAFVAFCASLPEWGAGRDGAGALDMECWANGATDHAWLNNMLTSTGLKNPVPYWNQRDYRTMKTMYPDTMAAAHPELVHHTASGDAMHQALHLAKLLRHQHGYPTPQFPGHDPFMPADEVWEEHPWAMFAATDGDGDVSLFDKEPAHSTYSTYSADRHSDWAVLGVSACEWDCVLGARVDDDLSDEASAASLRRRPEHLIEQPTVLEDEDHRPA